MKLGVMIEAQEGVGWDEWRQIVQWTEELDFESLWRSDHFFALGSNRAKDSLETFASLLYVAGNTSRIRFGPLVSSMTFRHPAMVARMAAAIDQLSNGRFILGIGAGWNQLEHEAFGIGLPSVKERLDGLEEGVQVIRALFETQPASFDGKIYQLRDAYLNPKPVQAPFPILIGGSGEKRTLRTIARYGNEWNASGVQSLEFYRQKREALEEHCEREGRDPSTIARSIMMGYVIAETPKDVATRVASLTTRYPPRSLDGGLPSLPMLVGTPSQAIETLQALEEEGIQRVMLQNFSPPSRDVLELAAKEILPKV